MFVFLSYSNPKKENGFDDENSSSEENKSYDDSDDEANDNSDEANLGGKCEAHETDMSEPEELETNNLEDEDWAPLEDQAQTYNDGDDEENDLNSEFNQTSSRNKLRYKIHCQGLFI